jgi:hypothetical protein
MVVFVIKCTNTWLGILCSNKVLYSYNIVMIVYIYFCVGQLTMVSLISVYQYRIGIRMYYSIQ